MDRRRQWAWLVYLAAGGLTAAGYFAVGAGRLQNVLYDVTAASSVAAILLGVHLWKPKHRKAWYFLAAYQALTLLGELVYDWYDLVRHLDAPVPSLADAGFLLAYLFLVAGVAMLVRERSPSRDRGTALDVTIVATGFGLLWWILIVLPTARGHFGSWSEELTTLAYPLMDIALLFLLVRLAFQQRTRTVASRLLTLSMVATLVADIAYAVINLNGAYIDGGAMDLGWIAGFVLMGASALHPSMRVVPDATDEYHPRFGPVRVALLTGASLMAPGALLIVAARHDYGAIPAVAAGSAALFVLVVVRMAGLFRDVQSKVDALDARGAELRQAEARYRTVVEHIPAMTFLQHIDPKTGAADTIYVSPQVDPMFGYTQAEWTRDRPWEGLVDAADLDRVRRAERARVETGTPAREEYRMHARDGRLAWVHSEVVLVETLADDTQVWQGVLFDVTPHKVAEGALSEALDREREAAARLRALDEMKSTFLHAVSHDLRTPLTAIMGSALTLDRDDVYLSREDQRDLIHRVATNSRKLDRLLADLLDLNRLDHGIVEPLRRPTDVGMLARRMVEESDQLAERRVELDVTPGLVDVDPATLERIVENLIANAIRHTPDGTPVWVSVSLEPAGVLIAVEDAGTGVPEAFRETIFEPFAQAPTHEMHPNGVGIGLSLVARFAALHGGRAWVQERVGGGASFRVFLPGRIHGEFERDRGAGSAFEPAEPAVDDPATRWSPTGSMPVGGAR